MPFNPRNLTVDTVKGFVDRLSKHFSKTPAPSSWPPKRAELNEAIARALGFLHWHDLKKSIEDNEANPAALPLVEPAPAAVNIPLTPHSFISMNYNDQAVEAESFNFFETGKKDRVVAVFGSQEDRDKMFKEIADRIPGPILWVRSGSNMPEVPSFEKLETASGELFDVINIFAKQKNDVAMASALCWMMDVYNREQYWITADPISIDTGALLAALIPSLMMMSGLGEEKGSITTRKVRDGLSLQALESLCGCRALPSHMSLSLMSYLNSMRLPGLEMQGMPLDQFEGGIERAKTFYDRKRHSVVERNASRLLDPAIHVHAALPTSPRLMMEFDPSSPSCPYGIFLPETKGWFAGSYLEIWLDSNPGATFIFDNLPAKDSLLLSRFSSSHSSAHVTKHHFRGVVIGMEPEKNIPWPFENAPAIYLSPPRQS